MDQDQVRETLEGQIDDLVRARRESQDPQEKAAASEAIAKLQGEVDRLNLAAADGLGAKVDSIVASLQQVLDAHGLDAASALGRSIKKIKSLTQRA
jgi:hypothetical protein